MNAADGFGALGPGALSIAAEIADGRVSSVRVASTRPTNLARLFVRRPAEEAPELAERIFSLCGVSHRVAARRAIAAARGETVCVRREQAETIALLCDRLSGALRSTVIFALGESDAPLADVGAIRPLSEIFSLARDLCVLAFAQSSTIGANRTAMESPIRRICALGADLGLPVRRKGALAEPKKDSLFDPLWRQIAACGGFAANAPDALSGEDDAAILERIRNKGEAFSAAPSLPERRPETGAFARHWRETQFSAGGLATRLQARMIDLAESFERLEHVGGGEELEGVAIAPAAREGFAAVETSRGRLCHWARLDPDGRIAGYTIVAPTEWNFHPAGPFVATLLGAPIRGVRADRAIARLASLFDPCVPFRVAAKEAEGA